MSLSIGQTIKHYHIVKLLGEGAQSNVLVAMDGEQDRKVVIKGVRSDQVKTLCRNFNLLARLRHPNLVHFLDLFFHDRRCYLVLTYAPGSDFTGWAGVDRSPSRISLGAAAILRAIQYLHSRGLIHRDLKPANIRVDDGSIGLLPAARVINFGFAAFKSVTPPAGTFGYAAPEVLAGNPATPASDLYSFGVLLYEALFGYPPHPQLALMSESIDLPPAIQGTVINELLQALLHSQPERRPTISTVFESLSEIAGRPLQVQPEELKTVYLPSPPLIGRENQLEKLRGCLAEVMKGKAFALYVRGCGKTFFALEVTWLAKCLGMEVIATDMPFSLLSERRRRSLELPSFEKLSVQLVDALLKRARHAPLLLNLDGTNPEDPMALSLLNQFTHALSATDANPILILWTGELPLKLEEQWTPIDLPCLNPQQVSAIVQGMLYVSEPPLWINHIFSLTGGDPRLVVDVVRGQIEAGLPDVLVTPSDRAGLAKQRLNHPSDKEKRLLAIMAHTPRPISHRLLKAVAPEEIEVLPSLLNRGHLVINPQGISLANPFLKRTAQKEITGPSLLKLHQRFCEILESEEHPDRVVLGHHLIGAGHIREGAQALLQASAPPPEDLRQALSNLPHGDDLRITIQHYFAKLARAQGDLKRALAIAEELEKENAEAGFLLKAEIFLDVEQPLPALQALGQLQSSSMMRHLLAARAYLHLGDYDRVLQETRQGRIAAGIDPAIIPQFDNLEGLSLIYSGQAIQGVSIIEQAISSIRALEHLELVSRLQNSRGIGLQWLGRFDEAEVAYQEVFSVAQQLGDLILAAVSLINLGTLAHRKMDLTSALNHFRKAGSLAHRGLAKAAHSAALSSEANLLLLFGDLAQAKELLQRAQSCARETGATSRLGHIQLYQAELHLILQEFTQAQSYLHSARECFSESDDLGKNLVDLVAGEIYLAKKESTQVHHFIREIMNRMAWDNPDRWRVHFLAGKTALMLEPAEPTKAVEQLQLSLALMPWPSTTTERKWEIHAGLAQAYKLLNCQDEAAFHANTFQKEFETLRIQIPLPFRNHFQQKAEVQEALARTANILSPSAQSYPSLLEFQQLLEINKDLNRRLPLEQLLKQIMERAVELTGAERGFALLKNEQDLNIVASYHIDADSMKRGIGTFSTAIANNTILENRPIMTTDAMEDSRFKVSLSVTGLTLRAVLCAPLRIRGEARGALYVDHRFRVNAFQQKHVALLEAFADQAGIALETARLLQEEVEQRQALAVAKSQLELLNRDLEQQIEQQTQELDNISLRLRNHEEELIRRFQESKIIGRTKGMRDLYAQLDKMAEVDLPVFIFGESGTGKELVARSLHYTSPRKEQPFISVNCSAIPQHLLESELFGHRKGAFTGATRDRAGLFEIAGRGTLFLDEIGDMPINMQAKLLRVLQEGTFRRVGDEEERYSSCRVLSASNKRLDDLVKEQLFRQDLYYRLNVLQVDIPPLRERREDIPLLVEYLLALQQRDVILSPAAMAALMDYDWPGNVRQLENEIMRAAVLCERGSIDPKVLTIPTARMMVPEKEKSTNLQDEVQQAVRIRERQVIEAALKEANYNVTTTAKRLGLHRVVLHRKIRKLGIELPERRKR